MGYDLYKHVRTGIILLLCKLLNVPCHHCSNSGKAMSLLLEARADVNSKGGGENTALMVAAALGHNSALSVLLAYPLLNIHAGVGHFQNLIRHKFYQVLPLV